MTEIVTESVPSAGARLWRGVCRLAASTDPLVETGNWVALTIGSHLPFWPLYVWWSAGREAWPSALLTITLAPVFLLIPWLSRRSGLAARVATPVAGVGNTVFTIWVLGPSSGSALFFAPCAALAALLFRRSERWLMLALTTLPLIAWYLLMFFPPTPVHRYSASSSARLVELNTISIVVLISFFGWLQTASYQRMERR
ncbi:hypothetical protein [Rhodopila sp.]|uniref:hypothetical protein n=1 Tax=Rhodopila sp. TaxID=2480087 RepID=UPI003D0CD9FF